MNGEWFDNGILRVFVPSGWLIFYGIDSDGKESPKKVHIYKGAEIPLDLFSKAGITICFWGKNEIFLSPKAFYDDPQDLEPFEMNGLRWSGYTCTSCGYPYTMLEARGEGVTFQVMILTKNGEHEISTDDADVKTIVESLTPAT